MADRYDLTRVPDQRFINFRSYYTPAEHLMSIQDAQQQELRAYREHSAEITRAIGAVSANIGDFSWAVESRLLDLTDEVVWLRESMEEGFRSMQRTFTWGIARICWEMEQNREVYRQVLYTLKHPLETQAMEHRDRAEFCLKNHLWEEAVDELCQCVDANPFDYLAHMQLGRVLFFQFGQSDDAMEEFKLAVRYADVVDANEAQRYYAALTYAHMAMLTRLGADEAADRPGALGEAAGFGARAVKLSPTLAAAVLEHVLDLLLMGDVAAAQKPMLAAFGRDEDLLIAAEASLELADHAAVPATILRWRQTQPIDETRQLVHEAKSIIEEFHLPADRLREAQSLLAGDLQAPGSKPRESVGEACDTVRGVLGSLVAHASSVVSKADTEAERIAAEASRAHEAEQDYRAGRSWDPDRIKPKGCDAVIVVVVAWAIGGFFAVAAGASAFGAAGFFGAGILYTVAIWTAYHLVNKAMYDSQRRQEERRRQPKLAELSAQRQAREAAAAEAKRARDQAVATRDTTRERVRELVARLDALLNS